MLAATLCAVAMSDGPFRSESFSGEVRKKVEANYLVSLPKDYDKDRRKRWPLILFLHGAGERGTDVQKVAVHGPLKEVAKGRDLPFIVAAPQCPEDQFWDPDTLIALLNRLERQYRVDKSRVYLTGLSMGGYGTWGLSILHPNRFAAIAPICGGGNWRLAGNIKDIPTWVVHGDADQAVPITESNQMVEAIRRAGGNPRYDIVVGGGHDVWTDFYAKQEFYDWLLKHRLPEKSSGR